MGERQRKRTTQEQGDGFSLSRSYALKYRVSDELRRKNQVFLN